MMAALCRKRVVSILFLSGLLQAGQVLPASQAELDKRCEEAREKKIAPLRQARIDECRSAGKRSPASCETFYSTYGDATGSVHTGAYTPRMFNDLPECVAARNARDAVRAGSAGSRGRESIPGRSDR